MAWQKLFGPEFAADAVTDERARIVEAKALKALQASAGLEKADPANAPAAGEEFIQDKLRVERRYDAHINAVILGTSTGHCASPTSSAPATSCGSG